MGSPGLGGVGDAQRGAVSVLLSSGQRLSLAGPDTYSRFGSSCAVLDLNADGRNDLVVGAPQTGGKDLVAVAGNYSGAVHVFLGSASGLPATPSLTLSGAGNFSQLGSVVVALNGSLLALACPTATTPAGLQAGLVALFRASPRFVGGEMDVATADVLLPGTAAFGWFGSALALALQGSVLLVGAPGFRTANGSVGALHVFNLSAPAHPQLTVTGTEDRAGFGSALAAGASLMAVAAPFSGRHVILRDYASQGTVYAGSLAALARLRGNFTVAQVGFTTELRGGEDFACLGSALAVHSGSGQDVLIATSPRLSSESGGVLAWAGTQQWRVVGDGPRQRLGAALVLADFTGDGVVKVAG